MSREFQRTEVMARVAHGAAGAVILLEALSKLEEESFVVCGLFGVFGAAMLLFAALHSRLHNSAVARYADAVAFLIEAAVQGVVAWSYLHHGKRGLPWVFGCVCFWYVGLAVWRLMRPNRHHHAGLH